VEIGDNDTFTEVLATLTASPLLVIECKGARSEDGTAAAPATADCGRLLHLVLATPEQTFCIDATRVDHPLLTEVLQGPATFVGHDLKPVYLALWAAGLPLPRRSFDTMLAARLLDNGWDHNGLAWQEQTAAFNLAAVLSRAFPRVFNPATGQRRRNRLGKLGSAELADPHTLARALLGLLEAQEKCLDTLRLARIADLEMAFLPAVVEMEACGVQVDTARWDHLRDSARRRRAGLAVEMSQLLRAANVVPPNWDDSGAVKTCLRKLGLSVEGTSKTDLLRVAGQHPIIELLIEYRGLTYYAHTDLSRHTNPTTGRVHPLWDQLGAVTGRTTCSDPALQNIPRGAPRQCIVAAEKHVLAWADLSQIELRILAQLAGPGRLRDAFRKDEDVHEITANQIGSGDRNAAKAVNFLRVYGGEPQGLQETILKQFRKLVTLQEAEKLHAAFSKAFPEVAKYQDRVGRAQGGITRTRLGRAVWGVREWRKRLNYPIQGTAADGLKLAAAEFLSKRDRCPSARLIMTVHDELVVEVEEPEAEAARKLLVEVLEGVFAWLLPDVPIKAVAKFGECWDKVGSDQNTQPNAE
jgi:DNA polymerase I